jgi:geranylgeranyl diphosphate synthase, type II
MIATVYEVERLRGDDLPQYVAARCTAIERALARYLPTGDSVLAAAMHHAVGTGGKRLRPLICIAATEACGGDPELAMPLACALELIHAGCHVKAVASHAGDALIARAFELAADASPAPRALRAIQCLARALGVDGVAGGELLELETEHRALEPLDLAAIHVRKTASLIRAATTIGAIIAGAESCELEALARFGVALGLAFQIQEDLLAGDHRKATYPRVYGVERTRELGRRQVNEALRALAGFDERAEPLRLIALATLEGER